MRPAGSWWLGVAMSGVEHRLRERLERTGHGHVVPRLDGSRTKCGGPGICKACRAEVATLMFDSSTQGSTFWHVGGAVMGLAATEYAEAQKEQQQTDALKHVTPEVLAAALTPKPQASLHTPLERDLAFLVRQMAYGFRIIRAKLDRDPPDHAGAYDFAGKSSAIAMDYLRKHNLQGSPLRDDESPR